jgi:hypothetical protein
MHIRGADQRRRLRTTLATPKAPIHRGQLTLRSPRAGLDEGGVVLRIANAAGDEYELVASPDLFGESEVLIKGNVTGAEVLLPPSER